MDMTRNAVCVIKLPEKELHSIENFVDRRKFILIAK
jgi:hypothetical protein